MLLQGLMATASVLLSQKGGDIENVLEVICGPFPAPHMDGSVVRENFGGRRRVEDVDVQEKIARWEV